MACPNPTVMAADLLVPMSLPQPIDPYLNMLTTPGSKAFGVWGGWSVSMAWSVSMTWWERGNGI